MSRNEFRDLFDQKHELAGWLVILVGLALLTLCVLAMLRGVVLPWPALAVLAALVAFGLLTLLGVGYYRGLQLGHYLQIRDGRDE